MKLGCDLFGLWQELEKDFRGTLEQLTAAGFTAVEPQLGFRDDPALAPGSPVPKFMQDMLWDEPKIIEYSPMLNELGLSISSMHAGFLMGMPVDEGCRQMIELSESTGVHHFLTSLIFDSEERTRYAVDLMNEAAKHLSGTGVTLGYHNHWQEFGMLNETETFMDRFLAETDPAVKLQVDVGWLMYGGQDVIAFMKKYADRIYSIHLKDFIQGYEDISQDDAFSPVGYGALPVKEIIELAPTLNLIDNGLMIDQDKAAAGSNMPDDLAKGAAYLKSIGA